MRYIRLTWIVALPVALTLSWALPASLDASESAFKETILVKMRWGTGESEVPLFSHEVVDESDVDGPKKYLVQHSVKSLTSANGKLFVLAEAKPVERLVYTFDGATGMLLNRRVLEGPGDRLLVDGEENLLLYQRRPYKGKLGQHRFSFWVFPKGADKPSESIEKTVGNLYEPVLDDEGLGLKHRSKGRTQLSKKIKRAARFKVPVAPDNKNRSKAFYVSKNGEAYVLSQTMKIVNNRVVTRPCLLVLDLQGVQQTLVLLAEKSLDGLEASKAFVAAGDDGSVYQAWGDEKSFFISKWTRLEQKGGR